MAVAGAVAAAQAIKASRTIVRVESRVFEHVVISGKEKLIDVKKIWIPG